MYLIYVYATVSSTEVEITIVCGCFLSLTLHYEHPKQRNGGDWDLMTILGQLPRDKRNLPILGSIWWWSGGGCGSLQNKQRALHMLHVAGLSPVMDMYFVCSGLDDRCVDTAVWSGFCLYGNKNTHTRCSQLRRLIPEHSLGMAARHHQAKSRICCFSIFHVRFDIPNIFHRCCSREWIKSFLTGSMEKPTRICCWGTQGICLGGVFWWQCLSNFLQVWINMQIEIWE